MTEQNRWPRRVAAVAGMGAIVAMGALTRERGFIGGGAKALQARLEQVVKHPVGSPAQQERRRRIRRHL